MKTLIFFLEEPSAKEMLNGVLPRLLPAFTDIRFVVFSGKQDLEKNLERKLRGWLLPNSLFVVMRDQDSGNCISIKKSLTEKCKRAGKEALVRICCTELESFYLGDLVAVEKGLSLKGLAAKQSSKKYRDPDSLANPSEELDKLTAGVYQKVEGSRSISPHLDLAKNRSNSFRILLNGLRRFVG